MVVYTLGEPLKFFNDRRAVEAIYPPVVFRELALNAKVTDLAEEFTAVIDTILAPANGKRRAKIIARCREMMKATSDKWEGRYVMTMFGTWSMWMKWMEAHDKLNIEPGNRFGRAHGEFLERIMSDKDGRQIIDETMHVIDKQGA